jgi:hypothetical protein
MFRENIQRFGGRMPLFFFIFHILYNIHSFISHSFHLSIAIRWGLSPYPHCLKAQWEDPPCGAEPRIELGPALQQADALPTASRRATREKIFIWGTLRMFLMLQEEHKSAEHISGRVLLNAAHTVYHVINGSRCIFINTRMRFASKGQKK